MPIYLDYNATTPIDPRVAAAMRPYLEVHFGNPSSGHIYGLEAKAGLEKARAQLAKLLGAHEDEVIFTGGGTEANNMAIVGCARSQRAMGKGHHIITCAVEHPAVIEVCEGLKEEGFETTILPVDDKGAVDPEALRAAIRPETVLISIMHANNEVGTVQPIAALSAIAKSHQIPFHTDAAQSLGKIPVQVDDLGVDMLSIAGHKLYAPKGVGALYVRRGTPIRPLLRGANHEMGRRPGTENVLCAVGLGAAATLIEREEEEPSRLQRLRDLLQSLILEGHPDAVVNGDQESRLPNTLSIAFPGLVSAEILSQLKGVAASAGAACHDHDDDDHGLGEEKRTVLGAMGASLAVQAGTLRLSLGRYTTEEEVRDAAGALLGALRAKRSRPTLPPELRFPKGEMLPGDVLVLARPLGAGLLSEAHRKGHLDAQAQEALFDALMTHERLVAEVCSKADLHCATSLGSAGFLPSLISLAGAGDFTVEVWANQPPLLPGALELAREGVVSSATQENLSLVQEQVFWDQGVEPARRALLCDALPYGGLLVALPALDAPYLVGNLVLLGVKAAAIGRVLFPKEHRFHIVDR